jgi:hypothetical protein
MSDDTQERPFREMVESWVKGLGSTTVVNASPEWVEAV